MPNLSVAKLTMIVVTVSRYLSASPFAVAVMILAASLLI